VRVSESLLPLRRVYENGPDVLRPKLGEVGQDLGLGHSGGQVLKNIGRCDARALDAGFAAPHARGHRDVIFPTHGRSIRPRAGLSS